MEAMNTYLTVCFWMHVVFVPLRLLIMMVSTYPRELKITLGMDTALTLLSMGMFAWVIYLKYWAIA